MSDLAKLLYWIINMSIMTSVVGVILLGIRKIRFVPRRMVFLLWIIPLLRGVVPLYMNSYISIMNLLFSRLGKTVPEYIFNNQVTLSIANYLTLADEYEPFHFQSIMLERLFFVLSIGWMAGMILLIATWMVSYCMEKKKISGAEHWKDNVWFSSELQGAAVYGIIKPKVVMSMIYIERDIEYILQHEKMHIKRKDNLWRILGFGVAAIHWFNPLIWILLKIFLSDMEMACDEAVISKYDEQERRQYALMLIECKANDDLLSSSFGGTNLRSRICFIITFKKMLMISICGLSVLILLVFCALLTNAK